MKSFSMTDVGRRREMNQDDLFTSELAVGSLPNLFLVADGMGGHNAGEFASRYTVESVRDYISKAAEDEPVILFRNAFAHANRLLTEQAKADDGKKGMGTTLVAATVMGNKLFAANIGDSRLYLVNEDAITQITRDHSLVAEMVRMGEMKKSDARLHPDKNIITRAIGVEDEIDIDFFETDIHAGDYILMCTDGLTNMVEDGEIRRIILGQRDLVEKVERLVYTANENGGRDNITVVLVEPFSVW